VKLSDGRVAAVFSSLCAALDLARQPQLRRVRADDVIAESLVPVRIETAGGPLGVKALIAHTHVGTQRRTGAMTLAATPRLALEDSQSAMLRPRPTP
jgi:hypothetical protein